MNESLQLSLAFDAPPASALPRPPTLAEELAAFDAFGTPTLRQRTRAVLAEGLERIVPTYINEFWTARQRQANALHEVSYRACFKPQLPRFFIERLTRPGDVVYDPFMGRGTTPLEAALLDRVPYGNDVNPLSLLLTGPRLNPPSVEAVRDRLQALHFTHAEETPADLLVFFHPETLREIAALRGYLRQRRAAGEADAIDDWIALVALNRLTGHSAGFFSVYTLPPNQAVSIPSQRRINRRRNQTPPRRDVREIILRKSTQLLSDCDRPTLHRLRQRSHQAVLLTNQADATPEIASDSVQLVVTSPPFLNVVDYATDNWLRCWFLGIDPKSVRLTVPHKVDTWQRAMTSVFEELRRVLRPGGHVAFEVGEVHRGETRLEEVVLPCGLAAGLEPLLLMINQQLFTKTANCWGVDNNAKGTNTNRIVVFRKG